MIEQLDHLTNLVYQSALDGKWSDFLQAFKQYTDSYNGWLMMTDLDSGSPIFMEFELGNPDITYDRLMQEYVPNVQKDPFYLGSLAQNELASFRGTDIIQFQQLYDSEIYPFLDEVGCQYLLAGIPIRNRDFDGYLLLNRNKLQQNYDKDNLALMRMMISHVNRAFHLHNKLFHQERQLSLYKAILERNPYPLIVLDEGQNLLQCNAMAEHLLQGQSILVERNGKLVSNSPHQDQQLKRFIRSTLDWIQAKQPEPTSIRLAQSNEELILKAYPIHTDNDFNDYQNPCCVVELLSTKQPQWALFSEQYKITPKELRTVQFLYQGLSMQQIAEHSHLSFNTIKSQLMSVYSKTGLSSQRELVASLVKYI